MKTLIITDLARTQQLDRNAEGSIVFPHIRFDRALDFLIGDWLR